MTLETFPTDQTELAQPKENRKKRKVSRISEGFIAYPYMAVELGMVYLTGLLIAHYYVGETLGNTNFYPFYITPLLIAPMIIAVLFNRKRLYNVANLQRPASVALEIMKSMGTSFILLIPLGFVAGIASDYSRIWYVAWTLSSIGIVMLMRGFVAQILTKLSNLEIRMNRVAFFGDADAVKRTLRTMMHENNSIEVVGTFSEDKDRSKTALTRLIALGQETVIDRIVIAKNSIQQAEAINLLDRLSILPCEVVIHPSFLGDTAKVSNISTDQNVSVIQVQKKPISELGLFVKSISDRVMAFIGIILLSPLFALVAMAIKLDSKGPVLFKQTRHGYNQRKIDIWKFRTMSVMENDGSVKQAVKNDNRITRIGSFLRKSSIDELPQLFNVLMGEMSIVGPRPHPVALNDDFSKRLQRYNNRHKVKPGITGWAQINGHRGPTDKPGQMDKRVEYDLDYIENWSIWFDIKIIIATPYYGLLSKNAF